MSFTLYELSAEYQRLLDELERSETEEDEIKCLSLMESMGDSINEKVINVTKTMCSLDAFAKSVEESAEAMTKRAKSLRKKSLWLKNYLVTHMNDCELKKIEAPEFCVTLRKNPARVIIEDESKVPVFLNKITQVQKPDKKAIKDYVESGEVIDGVRLESSFSVLVK